MSVSKIRITDATRGLVEDAVLYRALSDFILKLEHEPGDYPSAASELIDVALDLMPPEGSEAAWEADAALPKHGRYLV